jgi:hypothetical protein
MADREHNAADRVKQAFTQWGAGKDPEVHTTSSGHGAESVAESGARFSS